MMLVSFAADARQHWGMTAPGGVLALSDQFPQWRTLRNVIEAEAIATVLAAGKGRTASHPDGSFTYDPPIPDPEKIICVGVNFPDRNAEYKDGQDAPPNMSLFIRFPRSFTGHGQPLIRPPESPQLDYEGEIASSARVAAASSKRKPLPTSPPSPSATKARSATGCATRSST